MNTNDIINTIQSAIDRLQSTLDLLKEMQRHLTPYEGRFPHLHAHAITTNYLSSLIDAYKDAIKELEA